MGDGPTGPSAAAFVLDLDLDAPAPPNAAPVSAPSLPPPDAIPDLAGLDGTVVVLAGPAVLRRNGVDALRRLAAKAHLGVSNTWGAKGVFAWDSPHHLGTVGLQARDYELGGFADAALIIGVGIDEDESPWSRWAFAPTLQLAPDHLDTLIAAWNRPPQPTIPLPPLGEALRAVCMPSYESAQMPLHPCRAIIEVKRSLRPTDRVAADAGSELGLWVARAFPTTEIDSVVVPSTVADDFAVTAAIACALRPRAQRVVALTGEPESAALEWARGHDVHPTIVVWGESGEVASPSDVAPAIERGGVVRLPVDFSRSEELVAVAGPRIAWT